MTEADVIAIADALGMRAEPLRDGEQEDSWGQWVVADLPAELSWWWLSIEDDSLLIALNEVGELSVSRSIRRVLGPPPYLAVTPTGSKLVTSREEAEAEGRRILLNRRRTYRRCHFCGEKTPPEWGERQDLGDGPPARFVCHGCMSSQLGVVF